MPNRWAVANGNWSNTATWNNGATLGLPTASDDVFANNQAVYIDTNITVLTLRNAASASAILASGSFYLNNGVTVNLSAANAFLATVAPLIIISGSNSARINGNNTGTGTSVAPIIQMTGSSTLTMSGSFTGGSGAGNIIHNSSGSLILTGSYSPNGSFLSAHLISMTGAGSVYVTGSLSGAQGSSIGINKTAGSGSIYIIGNISAGGNGTGIVKTSTGDIVVTGSLIASTGAGSISNSGAGTIRINGNVLGGGSFFNGIANTGANVLMQITGSVIGAGGTAYGINNTGLNSTIIISGSVLGGTSTAAGISLATNASTLIVTGSVIGSTTAGAIINSVASTIDITGSVASGIGGSGVTTSGTGIIRIIGSISSSIVFPGIQSTSTGQVFLTGPFYNINNRNAVFAQNLQLISGSTPTWTFDTETYAEQRTLYTQNYPGNFPSASNVRQGTVFGDTNQFTGTVAIPSTGSVLKGVPLDATTGSASFNVNNVWSVLTSSLTTTGSLGARLRNSSTVATDGAAITSKGKL
jgi:hypothetical protein